MRRDIAHYYERSLQDVFQAYEVVAREYFRQEPHLEPLYSMTFGLDYSFRYNMNGGAVTVRFMPYQNGTAVNVRYSIAQLFGARYGAHDRDMTENVEGFLGSPAYDIDIPVEVFLDPRNQVAVGPGPFYGAPQQPYPQQSYSQPQPQFQQPAPQPQPAPNLRSSYCPKCGGKLNPNDRFCPQCGEKIK